MAMKKLTFIFLALILLCSCGGTEQTAAPVSSPEIQVQEQVQQKPLPLEGRVICLDAGHGDSKLSFKEPVAPNSDTEKAGFVSGTAGEYITEADFNLCFAIELRDKLISLGANVIMTRTSRDCSLSNIARAEIANQNNADLMLRIHADGNDNPAVSGISMLVPTADYLPADLVTTSTEIGELLLSHIILATDAQNRGISPRSDMTGFNWSAVPVVLLEAGFLSNPSDEQLLITEEYRQKMISAIADALTEYYNQPMKDEEN